MRSGERAELEAYRDLFAAGPEVGEHREAGSALGFRVPSAPEARELTRIIGLESLEQLDDLIPFFAGGPFWVSLDPEVGLDQALRERGLAPAYSWQKFEREPGRVSGDTSLRIHEADDRFGAIFSRAYDMPATFANWLGRLPGRPGWHCFAAFDGDEPVATGAMFVAAELGWLGMGATLPSHRGLGAQTALLAARVTLAAELGLALVVTETGVARTGMPGPSYRNILRAGFRESYVRPNYALPALERSRDLRQLRQLP
jgi:GNAT superfamily N-acetyltransferase